MMNTITDEQLRAILVVELHAEAARNTELAGLCKDALNGDTVARGLVADHVAGTALIGGRTGLPVDVAAHVQATHSPTTETIVAVQASRPENVCGTSLTRLHIELRVGLLPPVEGTALICKEYVARKIGGEPEWMPGADSLERWLDESLDTAISSVTATGFEFRRVLDLVVDAAGRAADCGHAVKTWTTLAGSSK